MFKDWAQVKACYKSEQICTVTQITNFKSEPSYQNQFAVFGASDLCNAEIVELDDKSAGSVAVIWDHEMDSDLPDDVKEAVNKYRMNHKDVLYPPRKARYFENVKAPTIELHGEFNYTLKSQNFAYMTAYYVDETGYMSWYRDLQEVERTKKHLDIITADNIHKWGVKAAVQGTFDMLDSHKSPTRKFYEWCRVDCTRKENWWKQDDNTISFMNPNIISLKYDGRFKNDLDKYFPDGLPNIEHSDIDKTLYFRQDYEVGNGYRVMNWESYKSTRDIWKDHVWDSFGKNWDKLKDITRGEAYPGIICTYSESTPAQEQLIKNFLESGHTTTIENN
tara:strand:- start:79 stop:1080 length:1002 start_codon:yes stop_codon:yes gene_type:complete